MTIIAFNYEVLQELFSQFKINIKVEFLLALVIALEK